MAGVDSGASEEVLQADSGRSHGIVGTVSSMVWDKNDDRFASRSVKETKIKQYNLKKDDYEQDIDNQPKWSDV